MAENEKVIAVQRTAQHFYRTRKIWQYDVGHVLRFDGFNLPFTFQVHFARSKTGEAKPQVGQDNVCEVPPEYTQNSGVVYAWLYEVTEDTGLTKHEIEIPVEGRAKPTNQEPTPAEQSVIDQTIAASNNALEKTLEAQQAAEDAAESVKNASATAETLSPGSPATVVVRDVEGVKTFEFGIPEGQKGETGERGPQGEQGIQGVQGEKGETGEKGEKGDKGDKGDTGATGATGPKGDKGDQGIQGIQGPKGDTGEKGDKGDTGEQGPKGDKGDPGEVTQAEFDALVIGKADVIISSASGAIASFSDGGDGLPVKELTVGIEPVQDLHGYDHPWPAGGGKNIAPVNAWSGHSGAVNGMVLSIPANTEFTFSFVGTVDTGTHQFSIIFAYSNGQESGWISFNPGNTRQSRTVVSLPYEAVGVKYYSHSDGWSASNNVTLSIKDFQIELGSTATDFAPYSNICPISGWDGVKVTRAGVNVWDEVCEEGHIYISNGENATSTTAYRSKNYIPVRPNTTYLFRSDDHATANNVISRIFFYDEEKAYIYSLGTAVGNRVFTTPENAYYIRFYINENIGNKTGGCCVNYPDTDTEYHAYSGSTYSITLPSEAGTIYGGQLTVNEDGTGRVVVDRESVTLDGSLDERWDGYSDSYRAYSLTLDDAHIDGVPSEQVKSNSFVGAWKRGGIGTDWSENLLCTYTSVSDDKWLLFTTSISNKSEWLAWLAQNPVQLVYPLATPVTYTLSASQVQTILGLNNVWADAGDVDVIYRADTKLYIDNKITQAIAAALNA